MLHGAHLSIQVRCRFSGVGYGTHRAIEFDFGESWYELRIVGHIGVIVLNEILLSVQGEYFATLC